jgi:hypothetical protein
MVIVIILKHYEKALIALYSFSAAGILLYDNFCLSQLLIYNIYRATFN